MPSEEMSCTHLMCFSTINCVMNSFFCTMRTLHYTTETGYVLARADINVSVTEGDRFVIPGCQNHYVFQPVTSQFLVQIS